MSKSCADDEPDYMSDDFLAKCIPEDIRPGFKRTHKSQREYDMQKKKDEQIEQSRLAKKMRIPTKIAEIQTREEGLQKAIDSSNKGFALLKKMGYKEGESLGKSNTGRLEPIPIEVRNDRSGIGREDALQRVIETKYKIRQKHREDQMKRKELSDQNFAEEFRKQQSRNHKLKQIEGDLNRSKKTCYQLDQAKGFTEPIEMWFWPDMNKDENDSIIDDDIDGEPIKDEKQLSLDTEEASVTEINGYDDRVKPDFIPKEDISCEFLPEEQLNIITEYLRSQYLYCLWCGITFSDNQDMSSNCPGSTRDDHE